MDSLFADLRDAWRSCRSRPATTIGIIFILALGIGPTTSISGIVDGVLIRRLPVQDPESLIKVFNASRKGADEYWTTSFPIYRDYAESSRSFVGLSLYREGALVDVSGLGQAPERVRAAVISGSGFGVLGIRPLRGRVLLPADDLAGAEPAVVISHSLWQRRFDGQDDVLGRDLTLNGAPFRIVGVAPIGFRGVDIGAPVEVWAPLGRAVDVIPSLRGQVGFRSTAPFGVVGRLRPGVTRDQAQAELETIAAALGAGSEPTRFEGGEPWAEPWPRVVSFAFSRSRSLERLSLMVTGAVLLVLLTACLNVTGLLLARAERNRRDTALRLALGAPRFRLARQLCLETLLYGMGGAVGATIFAIACARWVGRLAPPELPFSDFASSSSRLWLTATATVAASLMVGLVSAHRLLRRGSSLDLWRGLPKPHATGSRDSARRVFVALQVAACAVVIASAGLFVRSLHNLENIDLGIDADHVVVAAVSPARGGYSDSDGEKLLKLLLDRMSQTPGTRGTALSLAMPPLTESTSVRLGNEDRPVGLGVVSPGYFDVLGIRQLRGRVFEPADRTGAPTVAIVNRAFAERYWPGQDPVGRAIDGVGPAGRRAEVVGLVENVRNEDLLEPPGPAVYVPLDQFFQSWSWQRGAALLVATRSSPATVTSAMRSAIAAVDPNLFVEPMTVRESLRPSFARVRFLAFLLALFGLLVVAIAAAGIAAVVASEIAARRRELAVRSALGARPAHLQRLVFGRSLALIGGGLLLGLPGAALLGKGLSATTSGVPALDPVTLAGTAAILLAVGLAACVGPALRVARARIADVLRSD